MDNAIVGLTVFAVIIGSLLLLAAILRSGKKKHDARTKEESILKRIEELEKKVEVLQSKRATVLAGKNNE